MDKASKGFIKLDRAIFEHWIFQDAEKFRAFVDLIQLMRWKEEKLVIGNKVVDIPRGSYYTSELKLAERWGWSRNKTRDYLKLLESEGMITKKGTTKGTMLSLENYDFYQGEGTAEKQQKDNDKYIKKTSEGTAEKHQKNIKRYTKEEIKEYKEVKEGEERKEVKENIPQLEPLSFPTPSCSKIYKLIGENGYRFFMNTDIKENDETISIKTKSNVDKTIIAQYIPRIDWQLNKRIEVS